jgi:hypothetical protein
MNFYLEPMSDRDRERYKNNSLKDWRRENREDDGEVAIIAQQSTTHNRWRGLGTIFIKYFRL